MQIKSNIWKHETSNDILFIKKYENLAIADKVKFIHKQLEKIQFPYVIPLKKSKEPDLLVQRWQKNSLSADFSNAQHRKASLNILKSLHETGEVIDWRSNYLIPRQHLLQKWHARLEKFLLNERDLVPYLQHSYYDITLFAKRVLNQIRKQKVEKNRKLTLLHGDVVHHNFLICDDDIMRLIDFDLATIGDPAEELILWMHRALPNVEYDVRYLINENPYIQEICLPKIYYLQYPNELLREWLFVLQLGEMEREAFLDYLMPFTEKALRHWPDLVAETEKIKSSRS